MADGHKKALELIAENKRTRTPFLNLSNFGLTEVPEEMGNGMKSCKSSKIL